MELDYLKKPWQQATEKSRPADTNIMELIQNKSYGPVATLKNRFKKQMIIIPLLFSFVLVQLSWHHNIYYNISFWLFLIAGIAMSGYFLYSYLLISKLQHMEHPVKANLEKQVNLLEKGYKWRLMGVRTLFVVYIILLEMLMYYKQEPSLVKWYAQPLAIRLLCYAALAIAFFFITRIVVNYKYGKHIRYLKELVQQMQ